MEWKKDFENGKRNLAFFKKLPTIRCLSIHFYSVLLHFLPHFDVKCGRSGLNATCKRRGFLISSNRFLNQMNSPATQCVRCGLDST